MKVRVDLPATYAIKRVPPVRGSVAAAAPAKPAAPRVGLGVKARPKA